MKLRQNKDFFELSILFGVSASVAQKIFHTWLSFMYYQFKEIDLWCDREVVDQHFPEDFKRKYPQTQQ